MAPYLSVGLADLTRDDAALLDAVAAAFPPRHVSRAGVAVTVARTPFGQPIEVVAARRHPADDRGLATFAVDLTDADHREAAGGILRSGATPATAERLRATWVRR